MSSWNKGIPTWIMPTLSWLVSLWFLIGYIAEAGASPSTDIGVGELILLGFFLLFLFLPFFKRVRIGKWLELEREVEKTKTELRDFKHDVHANLALISTNVNTIGNLSNQVIVNLPASSELHEARLDLEKAVPAATLDEAQQIRDELEIEGEDTALMLARVRMRIEYLLRRILGKRLVTDDVFNRAFRYMSLPKLFREFLKVHPEYQHLERSFSYVLQVCNAAIHAQRVDPSQVEEVLDMGSRIIAILGEVSGANGL